MLKAIKGYLKRSGVNLEKKYTTEERLSRTLTGYLEHVTDNSTGKSFLLKQICPIKSKKYRSRFGATDYLSEIEIVQQFHNESSSDLLLHDSGTTTDGKNYLVYEYQAGNFLSKLIDPQAPKVVLPLKQRFRWVKELAILLMRLHVNNFIHRSVSPASIYLSAKSRKLSLIDYSAVTPNEKAYLIPPSVPAQPVYTAPEVIRRKSISCQSDVFAFGVLAFQLLGNQHPWNVQANTTKDALIFNSQPPAELKELVKLPSLLNDAIMKCLHVDPSKRHRSLKNFLMAAGIKH